MKNVEINNGQLMVNGQEIKARFPKPEESSSEKKKPGEGQMRWKRGSYLTEQQVIDEKFQKDNEIF